MAKKDLHKKPFPDETITKLEIFEAYLQEWLPVFIHNPYIDKVNVCDFFAGAGEDPVGVPGSPLRIMSIIERYRDDILAKELKIKVIFNEYIKWKFKNLCNCVKDREKKLGLENNVEIEYHNEDFANLFPKVATEIKDKANLIFLDQSGVKQITQQVFEALETFTSTDFMFFIASSFFNRFGKLKAFKNYFPDLDLAKIKGSPQAYIHRIIVEYYKEKLPQSSKTKLYPFTIKKDQNIYGLIFGTKNVLGAEKFLKIAWDKNKINGEANFDIDDDIDKQQPTLFPELQGKTKIEKFNDDVRKVIAGSKMISNKGLYDYALDNGFLPSHVSEIVRNLKKEGLIQYKGHTKISYDKCYKNPEEIIFKAIK